MVSALKNVELILNLLLLVRFFSSFYMFNFCMMYQYLNFHDLTMCNGTIEGLTNKVPDENMPLMSVFMSVFMIHKHYSCHERWIFQTLAGELIVMSDLPHIIPSSQMVGGQ